MATEEQVKEINSIIAKINREAEKRGSKDPVIFRASDRTDLTKTTFIPTGIDNLDNELGGGIARGLVTMLWGPQGCGKTYLAMRTAASVLKDGGTVLYIDLEGMGYSLKQFEDEFEVPFMNNPNFYIVRGQDHGDELVDVIEAITYDKQKKNPTNLIDLLIIDSITNIIPKANTDKVDKDGAEGGGKVGAHAKLMADFLTRYYGRGIVTGKQAVILISQMRAGISTGGQQGPTSIPSGGNAPLHDSKVIIRITKKDNYSKKLGYFGHEVKCQFQKNCVTGKPGAMIPYTVLYGYGLDDTEALLVKGEDKEWGFVKKDFPKRGFTTIVCPDLGGDVTFKNAERVELIRSNPEIRESMRKWKNKPKTPIELIGTSYTPAITEVLKDDIE